MTLNLPEIGAIITNDEIKNIFGCAGQGGMRFSNKTNALVLISDSTKLYSDKWIDGVLHYTGMGQEGDQRITYSQNKRLNQSSSFGLKVTNVININIHLFEVFKQKEYFYIGEVKLVSTPYQSRQLDKNGNSRNVWIFPIKPLSSILISKDLIDNAQEKQFKNIKKITDADLDKNIQIIQSTKPSSYSVTTNVYDRNPYIREKALRKANGICQLCGNQAPFKNKDGSPYLECHHIIWLSKGGLDSEKNTVALCPNCHRKMHVVKDPKDIKKLKSIV